MKKKESLGFERWGTSATRRPPPPSRLTRKRETRKKRELRRQGVHMLAAAGSLRPGPAYVWGRLGGWGEYVKIMIDSGNTVADLVSEEFAQQMGLDCDEVQDYIAVPTAATATTVLVVKRC